MNLNFKLINQNVNLNFKFDSLNYNTVHVHVVYGVLNHTLNGIIH